VNVVEKIYEFTIAAGLCGETLEVVVVASSLEAALSIVSAKGWELATPRYKLSEFKSL
jgi:hypothetical protein